MTSRTLGDNMTSKRHENRLPSLTMSDDEQHNHTFEQANAGASATYPMQCSALRKNGHVVIKGRPCKIVDMSTSKTGKHGHAKVHLVAIDSNPRCRFSLARNWQEDISPSTHNMDVPNVTRTEYQLVNVDDGFLNLMTTDGVPKDDVRVPDGDIGKQIQDDFEAGKDLLVTVTAAMGEEQAIAVKEAPTKSYSTKKYGTEVKAIQEVFPEWHEEDLVSLLQETHGSVETAIERITQGQATQWGSVPSKKSKKPPTTAPVRGGGRSQRGRGSSRGGPGSRGARGHRQTPSSSRPTNGEQTHDSTNTNGGTNPAPAWGTDSPAPAWGTDSSERNEPDAPATEAPKTNGTPVNGTSHPPTKAPTPAQSVKSSAPAVKASLPAAKSWADLLKSKATPPPVAKQPSPPQPKPQPQTQAPPPASVVSIVEPEPAPAPAPESEPEPEVEPEPVQEEELEAEPAQEPPAPESEPEPEPVEQIKEEAQAPEPEPELEPEPVPEAKIEPVVAAPPPPPPGLNLVTQHAPLSDPAPQAPHVSLPASVSLPATTQASWR
ncbi:unnamed protein product, partial [Rhizoctonia solani]